MAPVKLISYEEFGRQFVSHAVTAERVAASMDEVAGGVTEMGPMPAGPGGLAEVKALGHIGSVRIVRSPGEQVTFDAILPIDLELEVRVALARHQYRADVAVALKLTVRTAEPLSLLIEIAPVVPRDISVDLHASGQVAAMLQKLGDMESEIRKQVADTVNERISSERAAAAREIDVLDLIDSSWTGPPT